jgi:hypothetical protein
MVIDFVNVCHGFYKMLQELFFFVEYTPDPVDADDIEILL